MLTNEEYEARKNHFLGLHTKEIKQKLIDEKKKYLEYCLKDKNWKEFAKEYMDGVWFLLFIGVFALAKDVISFQALLGFALLELFIFGHTYGKWKEESEMEALRAYSNKTQAIVRDYMWDRMAEELDNAASEAEAEKVMQFYALALYDVPRNIWFIDVYRD